jgi:hypothetical protein
MGTSCLADQADRMSTLIRITTLIATERAMTLSRQPMILPLEWRWRILGLSIGDAPGTHGLDVDVSPVIIPGAYMKAMVWRATTRRRGV